MMSMKHVLSKLKAKRITTIVAIVIVFFSCIITLTSYQRYEETKAQFKALMDEAEKRNAEDCAYLLKEILRPNRELLLSTSQQMDALDLDDNTRVRDLLVTKAEGITLVDGLFFGRARDGAHLTSTSYGLPPGFDPRQRAWYQTTARNKGFNLSEPYRDASTNKLTITFSYPIYQHQELKGVLGLDIFLDNLKVLLNNFSANRNIHLCIFDNTGTVLYDTDNTLIGTAFMEEESTSQPSHRIKVEDYGLTIISILSPSEIEKTIRQRMTLIIEQGILQFFSVIMIVMIAYIIINSLNNRRIKFLLYHDTLTGLETRYALESKIEELRKKNPESILGLIVMNVDNFSIINNSWGHLVGDQALKMIAGFLQEYCKGKGFLYRMNGDEFALLSENCNEEQIENIANEAKHRLSENLFYIGNKPYDFTASMGVSLFEAGTNFDQVLYMACSAMRMAKDEGKNRVVCLFNYLNQSVQEMSIHNKSLTMLKEAIRKKAFILHLQPIVHLHTREIVHYEALVRLRDENDNLVMPLKFIPIAERYGLIANLDKWVFDEILSILDRYPQIKIYMNLSAISLNDSELLSYFEKRIKEVRREGGEVNLGVEITETATLRNTCLAANWITKFKELGCEIALDDFGVGYTSFSYLEQVPLDYIKIDGSFISTINSNQKNAVISNAINTVAVTLGHKSIAEYVENDEIVQALTHIGVEYGQGYGLKKPGPVDQIIRDCREEIFGD